MITYPSCKQATHAWPTSNLCPNKKGKVPIDGENKKVEICSINEYMTSCNKCKHSTFGECNDSDVNAKSTCCIAVVLNMDNTEIDLRALKFVDVVNVNLICCICQTAFIKPVISTCGYAKDTYHMKAFFIRHTFCEHCIYQALELSTVCPIDRTQLSINDFQPAAKIISNMVNELIAYCPYFEKGCDYTGQRQFMESHVKNDCQYTLTCCQSEECKKLLLRKDIKHHSETCKHRILECNMCKQKVPAYEMEKHYDACPSEIIDCPYCGTSRPRSEHTSHTTECPHFIISCPHHNDGCVWTGKRELSEEHLSLCPYESMKHYIQQQKRTEAKLKDDLRQLRSENESLKRQQLESRQKMNALTNQLEMMFPGHFTNTILMLDHDILTNEQMHSTPTDSIHSPPIRLGDEGSHHGEPSSTAAAPALAESQQRMNSELETLSANIASLELKQNMALMTETFRLQEELQSLRAVCHGLRMQMHYLMTDRRNASTGGTTAGNGNGAAGSGGTNATRTGATGSSVVNSGSMNTTRVLPRIHAYNATSAATASKQETKL
ncbi:hypothetical protein BDF20DRAFT_837235 [Mycotypha africana]|uniref:uncharacterized protein n=1 Tax=Mycotypha africana TaxID=64632 RepID=UPI00230171E4|nr:uncharacterized protein BDF20DRAFT_837235 [Mycotypha africana]KAI8973276.1 hypothetical protein BDF20DRAFT_837235 [Mycotypha africana]